MPCDYPDQGDVRQGVVYASGYLVGTLLAGPGSGHGNLPLLHSPADVLRYALIDLVLGTTPPTPPSSADDWPIYATVEPTSPDDVVTVYDTQGRDNGRTRVDGVRVEHQGIQVRVRASSRPTGYAKAQEIASSIDQDIGNSLVNIGANQYVIYTVVRTSPVLAIGFDNPNTRRNLFTLNAVISLSRVS